MVRAVTTTKFVHREVDQSKHTAAYKIFRYTWDIYVPHMFVYTDDYMRVSGIAQTEDEGYNRLLPKQMIGGRYTIAQMAQLFDEGATIKIHNPEDAKTIYDIIRQHLADWARYLNAGYSFDNRPVPEKELMLFSDFADSLFGHAQRFYKVDAPLGSLMQRFEKIRGRKPGSGRKFVDPKAPVDETKPTQQMKGHKGFAEDILSKSQGRTPWS